MERVKMPIVISKTEQFQTIEQAEKFAKEINGIVGKGYQLPYSVTFKVVQE